MSSKFQDRRTDDNQWRTLATHGREYTNTSTFHPFFFNISMDFSGDSIHQNSGEYSCLVFFLVSPAKREGRADTTKFVHGRRGQGVHHDNLFGTTWRRGGGFSFTPIITYYTDFGPLYARA